MRKLTKEQKKLLDKWYNKQKEKGKNFTIFYDIDKDDNFSWKLFEDIEKINPCELLWSNINNYIIDKRNE